MVPAGRQCMGWQTGWQQVAGRSGTDANGADKELVVVVLKLEVDMKDDCSCDLVYLRWELDQHYHHLADLVWELLLHLHEYTGLCGRMMV